MASSSQNSSRTEHVMSPSKESLKDEGNKLQTTIAGGVAGLVSRFVIAPLDVVKIRLQLQGPTSMSDPLERPSPQRPAMYKGTLPTLSRIFREEGITGLWKGNLPAEAMYLSYAALQFSSYRAISSGLRQASGEHRIPLAVDSFISGSGAGAIATTLTYPLDLLRTRFAAQGSIRVYNSLWASVRDIAVNEGPRGFFQGLGAGVGQIIPYMGVFFATYESIRGPLGSIDLPYSSGNAAAGAIASIISKTGVFPLDLVRKRLQVQGPHRAKFLHQEIPYASGIFKTLKSITRNEGPRGLYRGLTVSLIKVAPASAVTMWTYEATLHAILAYEKKNNNDDDIDL